MPFLNGSYGIRRLLDSNQRVMRNSFTVSYVEQKFDSSVGDAFEMGFTVTTTDPNAGGFRETPIFPPASSSQVSKRNIQEANNLGIELRLDSRSFEISHSWVMEMQEARGYATPEEVFTDKRVVGFRYNGKLYEIVTWNSSEAFGATVSWQVTANANEIK